MSGIGERFAFFLVGFHANFEQDRGGLRAAHDRDARVGPHPKLARPEGAAAHPIVAGAETAADDHGELRHLRARDSGDQLRSVFGDPAVLVLAADHEAGDVLQEHERNGALRAQFDEMRALERALGEQDAVVGQNADRMAFDVGEAADERDAVARSEFGKIRTVDDARDDFAHVVGLARIPGHDAVQFVGGKRRRPRCAQLPGVVRAAIRVGDDRAHDAQRMFVVDGEMIRDA